MARDVKRDRLRDRFAAAALTGLLARQRFKPDNSYGNGEAEGIALDAYILADAMMAERESRTEGN